MKGQLGWTFSLPSVLFDSTWTDSLRFLFIPCIVSTSILSQLLLVILYILALSVICRSASPFLANQEDLGSFFFFPQKRLSKADTIAGRKNLCWLSVSVFFRGCIVRWGEALHKSRSNTRRSRAALIERLNLLYFYFSPSRAFTAGTEPGCYIAWSALYPV
jgi:hypothetical protein